MENHRDSNRWWGITKKGVSKVDWFEPSVMKPSTRAGIAEQPKEYIYSSAGFYAERGGLIELDAE